MKIYKKVTNIYAIFLNKILYTYKKRSKKIKIFYIQLFLSLKKINYPVELKNIIILNRQFLELQKPYLPKSAFEINNYGMNFEINQHIDKKINKTITYSDLLIYLSKVLVDNICYLEIGSSVMKNFFQLENQLKKSTLVAFDINKIPKNYESRFLKDTVSGTNGLTKGISNLNKNEIFYFKGDVLSHKDLNEFNSVLSYKFNLIFSDALHTPEGLQSEFDEIILPNLSSEFLIYYDDLDFAGLEKKFKEIGLNLSKLYENISLYTFNINGWVGQNEFPHKNGVITNLNLKKFFLDKKLNLYKLNEVLI